MAIDNNPFQTVLKGLLDDLFSKKGVNNPFRSGQDTTPPLTQLAQAGPETMTDAPRAKPSPQARAATAQTEIEADPRFEARQAFFEGMVKRGMPPIAAAGFTGSIELESGFDPTIEGDINPKTGKPRSFGSSQVQRERRDAFFEFAKDNNKDPNNIETQMDFAIFEMSTTERPARRRMFDAKTVEEAAIAAITFFRPSEPKPELRLQNALKVQINGGTAPGRPAGAASAFPGVPTPGTPLVAPQGGSAGLAPAPEPQQLPEPREPVKAPLPPDFNLEVPTLAQGGTRKPIVPLLWQQSVAKFQESRDPKDLASVPKTGLSAILALMGRVARRSRT